MKTIYKRRLLKLARHLRDGKLYHDKFDIACYHSIIEGSCKTAGCAIGELPGLFPNHWYFLKDYPMLNIGSKENAFDDAKTFFGLNRDESLALFDKSSDTFSQNDFPYLKPLHFQVTKEEVAANIEKFVEFKLSSIDK